MALTRDALQAGFFQSFFKNRKTIVLIILGIGVLAYANSLFNPFIFDDIPQIISNPYIQQLSGLQIILTSSALIAHAQGILFLNNYYKPLLYICYAVLYSLFGASPFPFHLLQLIIHLANTVLIFFIFSYFFKRQLAFFLSLIFLIHPINNETVVYIANLQDVLYPTGCATS